jgi:hypothetical protein
MRKCVINFHFGKRYDYFELHKKSLLNNKSYDFLLLSDQTEEDYTEGNIRYVRFTMEDATRLINERVSKNNVLIDPRQFCDYKIFFGVLFKEYLEGYDWYGYMDSDVIFGNIDRYIPESAFEEYEMISNISKYPGAKDFVKDPRCAENLFGPFTLIKNNEKMVNLYKKINYVAEMANSYVLHATEENILLYVCRDEGIKILSKFKRGGNDVSLVRYPRHKRVPAQLKDGELLFYPFLDEDFYSKDFVEKMGIDGMILHVRSNHVVDNETGMITEKIKGR